MSRRKIKDAKDLSNLFNIIQEEIYLEVVLINKKV
jgi:hypothetical protein